MKYEGSFKSIYKDNLYIVEIITNGSSDSSTQLTLGPSPFTTTMDGGSNTIYNPVKYQSATVQVVADNYYFDMYASTPKQNTVELKDASNNVYFTGYISPNVFDANYNFVTETWDVECVDGLSVLKNYDYSTMDGSTKGFISFSKLIHNCLSKCGCYENFYISKALRIMNKTSLNAYDSMYISEQNFFDEDDKAMKMNEVLEEVCKFCGVVAVAEGKDVYLVDYDAIKGGNNTYYGYSISQSPIDASTSYSPSTTTATRSSSFTIDASAYTKTGTTLSLNTVYSKVTVKSNLYQVNSIIPSLFEDEDLRNVQYVDEDNQNWNYEPADRTCVYGGKESWLDSWEKRAEDDVYFYIKSRFYTNTKYNHYYFDASGGEVSGPIYNGLQAEQLTGVSFAKFNIGQGNTRSEAYAGMDFDSFDNYLMIPNNYSITTGLKRLEAKTDFSKPFFMSGRTKIVVKGELILTDRPYFPNSPTADNNTNIGYWPHTGTFTSMYDGNFWHGTKLFPKQNIMNLKIGLQIGDTSKTFNVPFYPADHGDDIIKEDSKNHEIFYKSFGVQDNISYSDGIKEKGYKLNMGIDADTVVPAKPIISIYGMDDMVTAFYTPPFLTSVLGCLFIKDFDVVAVDPFNGSDDRLNGTDTEYTCEINDEYTTELSPITFKICTSDTKSLNYSAVAYKDGSAYHFLNELNHATLNSSIPTSSDGTPTKRAEQICCYRIVNQYSTPCKKLSINLYDNLVKPYSLISESLSSSFIVDTIAHDYVYDSVNCLLVEKK